MNPKLTPCSTPQPNSQVGGVTPVNESRYFHGNPLGGRFAARLKQIATAEPERR